MQLFDIIDSYDQATVDHLRSLWQQMIDAVATNNDPKKIVSFLSKCCVLGVDEDKHSLQIGVPNQFVSVQVKKFFKKSLVDAIHAQFSDQRSAEFIIHPALQAGDHRLQVSIAYLIPKDLPSDKVHNDGSSAMQHATEVLLQDDSLSESMIRQLTKYFGILFDPKYTFERYVVGSYNELAHGAAKAIAEQPGTVYNPFFLYGGVGLGKTHLMQSIGNTIIVNNPKSVVLYMPTSTFIDKVIYAVRNGTIDQFKNKLQDVDVLMLDDIQFLAGKERTQEIFHNIFNEFYAAGKQIVITSDVAPKHLTLLESRLQSRFALGLVADVTGPDTETRLAILQSKLKEKDLEIEPEFLDLIASTVTTNVRELEGALNIVITRSTLLKRPLTENDIIESLRTLGFQPLKAMSRTSSLNNGGSHGSNSSRNVHTTTTSPSHTQLIHNQSLRYEDVIAGVSNYFGIPYDVLISAKRDKEISRARQLAMYFGKEHFGKSLQSIGDDFGGKNHASVLYSIGIAKKLLESDPAIRRAYDAICEGCGL